MKLEPLPEKLELGDKVCCPRHGSTEVLEVVKVEPDVDRIKLCRENGVMVGMVFNRQLLKDYDYMLVSKNN